MSPLLMFYDHPYCTLFGRKRPTWLLLSLGVGVSVRASVRVGAREEVCYDGGRTVCQLRVRVRVRVKGYGYGVP